MSMAPRKWQGVDYLADDGVYCPRRLQGVFFTLGQVARNLPESDRQPLPQIMNGMLV